MVAETTSLQRYTIQNHGCVVLVLRNACHNVEIHPKTRQGRVEQNHVVMCQTSPLLRRADIIIAIG